MTEQTEREVLEALFVCVSCGTPVNALGYTACECATGIIMHHTNRGQMFVTPNEYEREAAALRVRADQLDLKAVEVAKNVRTAIRAAKDAAP